MMGIPHDPLLPEGTVVRLIYFGPSWEKYNLQENMLLTVKMDLGERVEVYHKLKNLDGGQCISKVHLAVERLPAFPLVYDEIMAAYEAMEKISGSS